MSYNLVNPTTGDLSRVAGGGTLYADNPVGSIIPFGSSTIPSGYLLCNGQAVSRTTYSELFAAIGTAFGVGDGSNTFNVPDMRESVPKGAGLTSHTVGGHLDEDGLAVGEFLDDQIQNIGKMKAQTTSGYSLQAGGVAGYINAKSDLRTGNTTEVKSVGVNYIIKAKHVGIPADFIDAVEDVDEISGDTNGIIYHARKNNAVVCIDIEGTPTSPSETVDQLLTTLPQAFRPKNMIRAGFLITHNDTFAGSINVSQDGRIILYIINGTTWQSTNYAGSISYIV